MRQAIAVASLVIIVGLAAPVAVAAPGSDPTDELERLYQAWVQQLQLELQRPPQPGGLNGLPALPVLKVPELWLPADASLPDPEALLPPLPELPELTGPGLVEAYFGDWSNVRAGLEARLPAPALPPSALPSQAQQRAFLDSLPVPRFQTLPRLELPRLGVLPDLQPARGFAQDLATLAGNLGVNLTPDERSALDPASPAWRETFEQRVRALDATLETFSVPAARFPEPPKRQGVDLGAAFKQAQEALKARVAPWQEQLWDRAQSLFGVQQVQGFKEASDFLGKHNSPR